MKKKTKIILIILGIIIALVASLAVWQRNNLKAVMYYLMYSEEELAQKSIENQKKLDEALKKIDMQAPRELTEEETKYKTEEEIIMAGCAAYYENYYFESLLNANNTPQNNAAIQKVCEYFKSIYKAELRAGGKSLAEQMSKDTSIQDFLTGFEFDFEVAKQIVNNRAACLNLLKAISEGTIVINGTKTNIDNNDKIRLTQLLTSTLAQREWDRQLAEIEKTTMQEHVKE